LIRHHGREVKHTGDGIMAAFDQVHDALDWAGACLSDFQARPSGPALSVRIGMASGIPVDRHNDIFGETVVLASRLCNGAAADHVLVSEQVREAAEDLPFVFVGPRLKQLKGFPAPVTTFEVRYEAFAEPERAGESGLKGLWNRLAGRNR
jgi:class 3 adenylate cyclase